MQGTRENGLSEVLLARRNEMKSACRRSRN